MQRDLTRRTSANETAGNFVYETRDEDFICFLCGMVTVPENITGRICTCVGAELITKY